MDNSYRPGARDTPQGQTAGGPIAAPRERFIALERLRRVFLVLKPTAARVRVTLLQGLRLFLC